MELALSPQNCHVDGCAHIKCEYGGKCRKNSSFRKNVYCMSSYFNDSKYFSDLERYLVRKDTRNWGWSTFGVEYFLVLMMGIGHKADRIKGSREWAHLIRSYLINGFKPKYLKLPPAKDVKINIRPSQFAGVGYNKEPCVLSCVLGKVDKDHPLIKDRYKENEAAIVGTAMHRLFSGQPEVEDFIHNMTLKFLGQDPQHRSNGCEQKVIGSYNGITFGGSADLCASMDDLLFIGDMKRALSLSKEKLGYKLQDAAYQMATSQTLERDFKHHIFVSTKRNSNPRPHNYRYPRTNMSILENDFFDDFFRRVEDSALDQQRFFFDSDGFNWDRKEAIKAEKCFAGKNAFNCFDHDSGLCEAVQDAVKKGNSIESLLLPEYSLKVA